ncbi:MAG: hypothetical protein PHD81_02740 [Candidatus Nanoarchaeia archaeon]|nr:hypothetical protein [Candidatus Nanoarchaeia archaeon]MDD5588001.1 hypothetical protein [Candidatus Nanoarchaeia archaeon]
MVKRGLINTVLMVLLFLITISSVKAMGIGMCLEAHITDISPTSIDVGEEFTVGILIDNCGYTVPPYVTFELREVSPYMQVLEPLKQQIEKVGYATSDRFLLFHIKPTDDVVPGTYVFKYRLTYGSLNATINNDGEFSVKIIGDKAKLNIASMKTKPTLPKEGEEVELTLRVENYGEGSANSIKIILDHPFEGIKESFLGTLDSNEDGPAVFTFIAPKEGEYKIPVLITYKDDLGSHEVKSEVNVTILNKPTNIFRILLIILTAGLIGYIIYYLIQIAEKKEIIIKQLMNGNNIKKERTSKKK